MNGLCNLKNEVYQAIIVPKENVKDKKNYIGNSLVIWKLGLIIIFICYFMNAWEIKLLYPNIFWKLKNMDLTLEIRWRILKKIYDSELLWW